MRKRDGDRTNFMADWYEFLHEQRLKRERRKKWRFVGFILLWLVAFTAVTYIEGTL